MPQGFWDSLNLWPVVAYTVLADSILYSLYGFNKALEEKGVYGNVTFGSNAVAFVYATLYMLMTICSTMLVIYFLYRVGWSYLIWFPAVVMCSFPVGVIIGLTPFAQYIYPFVYVGVIASLAAQLGFFG